MVCDHTPGTDGRIYPRRVGLGLGKMELPSLKGMCKTPIGFTTLRPSYITFKSGIPFDIGLATLDRNNIQDLDELANFVM